ncbi:hypothetical protein VTN96DRAFT_743 [Rasamsonia emersonii]|uniref:Galactose oxidase n=1 Tax=Rasamsonia emersonii (strain ATCC 16479 / CBS 393.64 / IMI 116815) TaxID=1408163 RepID=A0A0F4YT79_RASE3|nr:hypothetical protein T310_4455 [Rasamsonia emersonii CBS 393.64]KKA21497.1 hypothetical protein T310_4455 [Rasamsonia emersonii CBS 393.64]
MAKGNFFGRCFTFYALVIQPVYAAIPYVPSRIFLSPQHNGTLAYLLQPKSSAQTEIEFLSLDLSQIDTRAPQYTVLYDHVPFQGDDEGAAFVSMMDSGGTLKVLSGNCQASDGTDVVWSFSPDNSSSTGNGTWSQLSVKRFRAGSVEPGPAYLAAGFTYAASNDTTSTMYTFGGMCPFANSTDDNWVSAANYSRAITVLDPSGSSYDLEITVPPNPPVAEAGFTITPLQGTSSTTSGGRVLQQQDFLLIGGHTQTAFINMSSLALFSLPQAGWTYIPVGSSVGAGRTNLAARDVQVEPRSGHSAVLSSDGSKIVVFGGWVGDTSTPADPQLVILELGEDYGGSGEWTWTVPSQPTGSGMPKQGSGIFGHAAAMLPGDVMVIIGGYSIPSSSSSKRSASGFEPSSQVYLYNLTSNTWVSSYTNPAIQNLASGERETGNLSSTGQKAGLGVGMSLAVVVLLGVVFCVYSRKRSRHRRFREQQLRQLALGAERSHVWDEPGMAVSFQGPMSEQWSSAYSLGLNRGYSPASSSRHYGGSMAERTGLLGETPNLTRGLQRSFSSRPQMNYSSAGFIHPIDERDEYEETLAESPEQEDSRQRSRSPEMSDPFDDPSPSAPSQIMPVNEGTSLLQDHTDGMEESSGDGSERRRSMSPNKNERTDSNLSESSASGLSVSSIQRSNFGSVKRRVSDKAPRLDLSNVPVLEPSSSSSSAVSGRESPEKEPSRSGRSPGNLQSGSDDTVVLSVERSMDSFSTAHTSQRQQQMESESLLGGSSEWATPPESPTRLSTTSLKRNSLSWMGSVRKTLKGAKKAANFDKFLATSSQDTATTTAAATAATTTAFNPTPSPDKMPRRAVSASAAHLRRKQGPRDWAVDKRFSDDSFLSYPPSGDLHTYDTNNDEDDNEYDDEEDWDVEAAAEGRVVQVTTFTVPKEKLRVVNAGVGDGISDVGNDDDETDRASTRRSRRGSIDRE